MQPGSWEALRVRLLERVGGEPGALRSVRSPYRICPVGAHVDHQGGTMLATAIDAATELVFAPADELDLESANFPGRVRFDPTQALRAGGVAEAPGWGRYVYAALASLRERLPERPRGFRGIVRGRLPGSGLSSSASVLLAYLAAWAESNGLDLAPRDQVLRALAAENEYVGVQCGILDPAAIVGSRRGALLRIDALELDWEPIPIGEAARSHCFLVLFTGTERNLLATDFNRRVQECGAAARWVAERLGDVSTPRAQRLGDLDRAQLRSLLDEIPGAPGRRARHFVEECDRVERAQVAWRAGDLEGFGAMMSESCRSSIELYETGSPELIALQQIWSETPGVLGARFSGAGFGGCSIALVAGNAVAAIEAEVLTRFGEAFPALRDRARMLSVESHDGLAVG